MKTEPSPQKLRGGYYTPDPLAKFITNWTVQSANAKVLEPGCGDGVFLRFVTERLASLEAKDSLSSQIRAVELNPKEAEKARKRLRMLGIQGAREIVRTGDFFEYCRARLMKRDLFDAVVGNPPFIRYQNFPKKQREIAMELMRSTGLHPSRLTNTWMPFLVGSTLLLKEHGRLGMVIPAELLQVSYAAELREFLSTYYKNIVLVTFERLVFGGIQQEVVLFLAESGGANTTGIRVVELRNMGDLKTYDHDEILRREVKPMDHTREKWTQYFLDKDEILLLRKLRENREISRGEDVLDIDVGVVTGQNSFFILTKSQARELGITDYTVPIVTRSAHFSGIVFSKDDWESDLRKNRPVLLLKIPPEPKNKLHKSLRSYITSGEDQGIHEGYKCRIRDPWYTVPSTWIPHGFMLRQIHQHPRIIVNRTDATSTDTIHRVKMVGETNINTVAAALLNSLTFAFSEVMGRSYGGGVLEMYPSEIASLPIPLQGADNLDIDYLNQVLSKEGIGSVLDLTDQMLLMNQLGLTAQQVNTLRGIWSKLRDRRINRR